MPGSYADGASYELLVPEYRIDEAGYGPLPADLRLSPRVAPAMIGLGLLEAIPEERLHALEDPDDGDSDGISGRVNRVWDVLTETTTLGRFGWKAEQPSVMQQVAGAFLGDIGITSPLFPSESCTPAEADCGLAPAGGAPEIDEPLLTRVVAYSQLLAVPLRARWNDVEIRRGQRLFHGSGCAACHTPSHTTGDGPLAELEGQVIWPYTDLLLHDMGPELSDRRPAFEAEGVEWRTPPLWGLGRVPEVNGHDRLLHDGRARGVAEAILWHGGEGSASREAFRALASEDREALVTFVESL
jgi:CxxC motif-containing protein (DUF1111 family)